MSTYFSMTPNEEANFRQKYDQRTHITMPKAKVCPCCKTPRSIRQFEGDFKNCKKCRGK